MANPKRLRVFVGLRSDLDDEVVADEADARNPAETPPLTATALGFDLREDAAARRCFSRSVAG